MKKRHIPKPGEFRLIRPYTLEHNIERLKKHVAKLSRRMKDDGLMKVIRLKSARRRREKS